MLRPNSKRTVFDIPPGNFIDGFKMTFKYFLNFYLWFPGWTPVGPIPTYLVQGGVVFRVESFV